LIRNNALPAERIRAIETGGCPHAAIREDISDNLGALEELQAEFETEMLFVESGGDNLAGESSVHGYFGTTGLTFLGLFSELLEGIGRLYNIRDRCVGRRQDTT
jgi:hypothetical protein